MFTKFFKLLPLLLLPVFATALEHTHNGWEVCAQKHLTLRQKLEASRELRVDDDDASAGNGRKYARDREIDVLHQKIEITPNFASRTLEGVSTISFKPIAKALTHLKLDAVDLRVATVESSAGVEAFVVGKSSIDITFENEIVPDAEANVTITYSAQPQEQGLFFRTEAMGYPKGDDHLWTQGEPENHRHWFPGYDYPNERFTTEVVCHVPEGMTVLSNGELVGEKTENGISTFHWHQKKPHVNYLVSVVAGYLQKLEAKHGDLDLAFYTTPSEFSVAENSFRDTSKILGFFEKELGVDYPWAKYYNVCVADFVAGGMENTSVTTLTNGTLFHADSENLHTSHRLDAHEIAHQWFGDLLTCRDWSQLWLNEGFATYYTHLYENEKNGRDDMVYGLWRDGNRVTGDRDERPITWRGYTDPMQQFGNRAYPKGSWVLHMLRSQLGEDLYRECVTEYLTRYRNQNVETNDLREVFEELSGRNLNEFFDQWVHHGGTPKLKIGYSWDAKKKQVKLSVQQTQKTSEKVLLFDFPLPVRFVDADGKVTNDTVRVHLAKEDFTFDLEKAPEFLRIDPDTTVLAAIDFKPANPLLFAQLEKADMMGRLLAAKELGGRKDTNSLQKLKAVLNGDEFYGVRIEAANSLGKTHSDESLAILIASRKQGDARVRKAVVDNIGKFFNDDALAALKLVVENEKNPDIVSSAIYSIGKFTNDEGTEMITAALNRESYRHGIANAAIKAIRRQADAKMVPTLRKHIEENESKFTTHELGNAFDTLAYLARDEDDSVRDPIRYYLSSKLNLPKKKLRAAVITSLGTLNDPAAIPVLETYSANSDSAEGKAASAAIKKLNGGKKQAEEVWDLRRQVTELQKQLKELGGKVEKLSADKK